MFWTLIIQIYETWLFELLFCPFSSNNYYLLVQRKNDVNSFVGLTKKLKVDLPEGCRAKNVKSQTDAVFTICLFQVTFIKDLQYKECKNMPKLMPVELFSPIEEVHYKKVIYQGILILNCFGGAQSVIQVC